MTTYRLPDWLGGHEARVDPDVGDTAVRFVALLVKDPDGTEHSIELHGDLLTKVEPPLPPVPDCFALLVGEHVYVLDSFTSTGERAWVSPLRKEALTDKELAADAVQHGHEIIPLVPDPAHGAPELPWSLESTQIPETWASVATHDGAVIVSAFDHLRGEGEHYHPDDAEQLGITILHAVRVVRAAAEQEASKP